MSIEILTISVPLHSVDDIFKLVFWLKKFPLSDILIPIFTNAEYHVSCNLATSTTFSTILPF